MPRPFSGPVNGSNPTNNEAFIQSFDMPIPGQVFGDTCPPPKVCNRCGYCQPSLLVGYSGGFSVNSTVGQAAGWLPDVLVQDAINGVCPNYPDDCDDNIEISFGAPLYGATSCGDLTIFEKALQKYGSALSLGIPIIYEAQKKDGSTETGEGCGPDELQSLPNNRIECLALKESSDYVINWVEY